MVSKFGYKFKKNKQNNLIFFLKKQKTFKQFNPSYKENLLKLKNFVLVQFNLDTMVVPLQSEVRKNNNNNNIPAVIKLVFIQLMF